MRTRRDVVAAAKSYLGTKWHHQGRQPGLALDCVGVGVCAYRDAGFDVVDSSDYTREPHPEQLIAAVEANCERIRVEEIQPGDFLTLLVIRDGMQDPILTHAGLVSEHRVGKQMELSLIHAMIKEGEVREHDLFPKWGRRIHQAWCYPELRGVPWRS